MIIRSQDKKNITNFNQITDIQVQKNNDKYDIQVYYPFSVDDVYAQMRLGEYSTEEKAIKVLDMICEAYCRMEDVKCGAVQARKYDSFCFNMPSDEEVEV